MLTQEMYLIRNSYRSLLEFGEFLAKEEDAYQLLAHVIQQFEQSIEQRVVTHSSRVALLAEIVGINMNFSKNELQNLKMSAQLHDIGKIFLPVTLFTKKEKLNFGEWQMVRLHPELGFALIKQIPHLSSITSCILAHHERFNGSGYPFGLKEQEIPMAARIIGLVDCFEALTAPRSYHLPLSVNQALDKMRSQTQQGLWDPHLFNIMEEIISDQDIINDLKIEDLEVVKN